MCEVWVVDGKANQPSSSHLACCPTFQRLNGFIEVAKSHKKHASHDVVEQNTNLASKASNGAQRQCVCVTHPVFFTQENFQSSINLPNKTTYDNHEFLNSHVDQVVHLYQDSLNKKTSNI